MVSIKNYPWVESLKVSEEDFKKWQITNTKESFVFWSLKNKIINPKLYFNWAMEYYQTPFLKNLFFEQYLMTKKQWEQIRDLSDWTPEMVPVAVWEDTVFIGCVELPADQEKTLHFKYRFVLTSSAALKTTWKFTQKLSKSIDNEEATQSQVIMKTTAIKEGHSVTPEQTNTAIILKNHPKTKTLINFSKKKNKIIQKKASFTPDIPLEKNHPFDQPLIHNPSIQTSAKKDSQSKEEKINSAALKAESSLPAITEERAVTSENNTFPGRSPHTENNNLISFTQQAASDTKSAYQELSLLTETTKTGVTVSKTGTLYLKVEERKHFENLWKQTRSTFCASMILKVKNNKIYPSVWSGHITIKQTDKMLADLKDYSLFKIVQKGHPYHGFAVETPANKKFFSRIGWDNYPKHITAIPIKNKNHVLDQIFTGLGVKPLSRNEIKSVEKIISDFFQSHSQKISQAA